MPEPLKNQIIAWAEEQPYWFKFAADKFLDGFNLSNEIINDTYNLFLEDQSLRPVSLVREKITFKKEKVDVEEDNIFLLEEIKEIENVNALVENQIIPISKNLTIIYGMNGTGKSGYIRLLNNAFKSRGDKNIIPNIFTNKVSSFSCKFRFKGNNGAYELEFPKDKEKTEFLKFSVHDTESVRVHLEEENQLTFIPHGFEFFNKTVSLYEALRQKLSNDIAKSRPINDFKYLFGHENVVSDLISNLEYNTSESQLTKLEGVEEEDVSCLTTLNIKKAELISRNIPVKIDQLQKIIYQLSTFIDRTNESLNFLTTTVIDNYESLITSFGLLQELSKQEGVKSLEQFSIENLGSNEWREFVTASIAYVGLVEKSKRSLNSYPSINDRCVYCLQPLNEKEVALIKSYWVLLKSESQAELNRTINKIREAEKALKGLTPLKFDDTTSLFTFINNIDSDLAIKWKTLVLEIESAKNQLITNLSEREINNKVKSFSIAVDELIEIAEKIKLEITDLTSRNTVNDLAAVQKDIDLFTDKVLLIKLHDKVLSFINAHKWAFEAEKSLSLLRTHSITSKQGQLFAEHITDHYTNTFNEECSLLNAPNFITINQRNVKGQTIRKLQIVGLNANKILSEGEQRAVGLADFLTEVQLNKSNKGIIFDDPVTSLDHQRREKIAVRLVDEAEKRQVIIFTHDISFLIKLQILAGKKPDFQFTVLSIRRNGNQVGIIKNDLPWVAQKVGDRIKYLKNDLVTLNKLEKSGSEDEYNFAVKKWYGLLRESWERAVEERLFKGVVQRFSPEIQTLKLKFIDINKELIEDINTGMTQSSKWVHDQAADLNPTIPSCLEIQIDLKRIEDFAQKCSAA